MICGNMEEKNKYWLEDKNRKCIFCDKGWDNLNYFVKECEIIKRWFGKLGINEDSRIMRIRNEVLDNGKREILQKFWKEKIKKLEEIKEKR